MLSYKDGDKTYNVFKCSDCYQKARA